LQFRDVEPGDPRLTSDIAGLLAELRPHITPELLAEIYAEGHPQGLRFTAAYDEEEICVAVAGWREMATTVAIRKLYVDDLVTASDARSRGFGASLLQELERRGREAGCQVLDLDSGVARADAHRFYFREHMSITSFHFARRIRGTDP
jgi:GNAT superfamily N-acetyltransferase